MTAVLSPDPSATSPALGAAPTLTGEGAGQGAGAEVLHDVEDRTWLCFDVHGTPVTQGSIRSLGAGRPSVHNNAARLKPWRLGVQWAAQDAMRLHDRLEGPVEMRLLFTFDRPRTHYRTGRNAQLLKDNAPLYPCTRSTGDIDKLQRAVLDAIEASGLLRDDVLVMKVLAEKAWAGEHEDGLRIPGVRIQVRSATA